MSPRVQAWCRAVVLLMICIGTFMLVAAWATMEAQGDGYTTGEAVALGVLYPVLTGIVLAVLFAGIPWAEAPLRQRRDHGSST